MKKLILILLSVILTGNLLKAQHVDDYTLNIMSFNVRIAFADDEQDKWEYRQSILYEAINRNSPDIIGLQESVPESIGGIMDSCSGYTLYGEYRDPQVNVSSEASHILYKTERFLLDQQNSGTFWFSPTPDVPGSKDPEASYRRICTYARLIDKTTGKAFYVYNNHWDNESSPARNRSAVLLEERINTRNFPNDPFIVTGDLNAIDSEASVKYLKEENDTNPIPMDDTYRLIYPDVASNKGYTKHEFNGIGTEKIDYVFIEQGGEIETLDASIETYNEDGRYPSDHFPILASLLLDSTTISFSMMNEERIYNQQENGKRILLKLRNEKFADILNKDNWQVVGFEEGVSIGSVEKVDSLNAIITLSGNASVIQHRKVDVEVFIAPSELVLSSDTLSQNVGVLIYPYIHPLPGKFEAEHYVDYSGIRIVETEDVSGVENIESTTSDFYMTYEVNISTSGLHTFDFRIAATHLSAELELAIDNAVVDTIGIHRTDGLQNWDNVYCYTNLEAGIHTLSLKIINGSSLKVGMNWIDVSEGNSIPDVEIDTAYTKTDTSIFVEFSRMMKDPVNEMSNFMVDANGETRTIKSLTIDKGYKFKYLITLAEQLVSTDQIELSYSQGNIMAFDGTLLKDNSGIVVANKVKPANSLNSLSSNAVTIYPNPVSEILTIQFKEGTDVQSILIYDILGNVQYCEDAAQVNQITIDVSDYKSGMYILKLVSETAVYDQSFIIN